MPKPEVEVLVISVASPLLLGVYETGHLKETVTKEGKSSDELPRMMERVMTRYRVTGLYYVKGPGSFMAIKIAYVFLKTLSVAKKIPLFAADAFAFNGNAPVKSIGKKYFVKTDRGIEITRVEEPRESTFHLPSRLEAKVFSEDAQPMYIAPAV